MWKKKIFVGVMVLLIGITVFAGCGKKETAGTTSGPLTGEVYPENGLPKDQEVTLSFIFPVAGYGKDYFQYAVDTFQQKFTNVKINVRYIEEGNNIFKQIINSTIQSGNDDEMYDWMYSVPNATALIDEGMLETQDELWERTLYDKPDTKMKDAIIVDKRSAFTQHGHMWGIPSNLAIHGLYFNKKWFREMGFSEQPKHWDEFMELCAKIKAIGKYPLVMAGKYAGTYFSYGWGAIPYAVGGDEYWEMVYNYRPDIYISKPHLTMLKRLEEFTKKGYLHPGTASFDHTQSQMEFVQGKAALITNATWIANEMKDVVPKDFEWGYMVFPDNNSDQQQVIVLRSAGTGYIWKGRPELNKKWVKEFNLWLLNLEVQKRHAQSGGVPTRVDYELDEEQIKVVSPSVVEALKATRRKDVKLIDNAPRARTITNNEFAKLTKLRDDGYIAIISKKRTAEQIAKELNDLYMKALRNEGIIK